MQVCVCLKQGRGPSKPVDQSQTTPGQLHLAGGGHLADSQQKGTPSGDTRSISYFSAAIFKKQNLRSQLSWAQLLGVVAAASRSPGDVGVVQLLHDLDLVEQELVLLHRLHILELDSLLAKHDRKKHATRMRRYGRGEGRAKTHTRGGGRRVVRQNVRREAQHKHSLASSGRKHTRAGARTHHFAVREGKEIEPTGVGITGTRRGNSRVLPSAAATLHDAIRCDVSRPKETRTPHGRDHAHHARKYPAVQQHRLSSQVFATACDAAPRRVSSLRPLPLRDPFTLIHFLYGVYPSIYSRFVFFFFLSSPLRLSLAS